jgi:arylsulfatase A-like enzyme
VLVVGLASAVYDERDVRRARPQFERRGGLVALTDLGVSFERGAPYANLDIERPERFSCPPPEEAHAPAPLPTPEAKRRNVILISIDTLRKDALDMQRDRRPVAPALRALAARSVSFERAITTYPATLFALSSALTGQSPSEVLFAPVPPPNLFTLTKPYLREQLIALPSTSWFRRSPVPELMTQRTVPTYWPDAERSTSWLIARLRAARAAKLRTIAWIHYFEPHGARTTGRGSAAIQSAHDSYAELVRRVDVQIGRLTEELDKLGYLEDSLVIVFSDHGEALGELDYFGHHVYLNQFATDVPLLVYAPGQAPRRSERLVLLSDIAPTVLDWVGVKSAPGDARSLFENVDATERYGMSEAFPIRGRALYDLARLPIHDAATLAQRMQLIRTAAIDYQPKVALVSARYRLIVNRVSGAEEFYDRVRDPTEEKDLSQDGLSALQDMREALRGRLERLSQRIYCRVAKNP